MTRGQIKQQAFQRCGLFIGDDVISDPDAVDNLLNYVTDTFAGPGMDCYWAAITTNIVANQSEYSAPAMYKIKSVLWLDLAGNWTALMPTSAADMDRISYMWRNVAPQSTPTWVVFEGVNSVRLYPTPNFSNTAALKFEGFCQTVVSGLSTWATNTSECPLPTWCHNAIMLGLTVELDNMMLASRDPILVTRATLLIDRHQKEYRRERGTVEKAAAKYYADTIKPLIPAWWSKWSF